MTYELLISEETVNATPIPVEKTLKQILEEQTVDYQKLANWIRGIVDDINSHPEIIKEIFDGITQSKSIKDGTWKTAIFSLTTYIDNTVKREYLKSKEYTLPCPYSKIQEWLTTNIEFYCHQPLVGLLEGTRLRVHARKSGYIDIDIVTQDCHYEEYLSKLKKDEKNKKRRCCLLF